MSISRIGSGTTQACAACKYQRRKCAANCILAPYFPHDRQRQFLNAHKLFGVSNITKIIKNLNPRDKDEAMKTIIIQSDIRANDPVGGCYRIICDLQRQIELHKVEYDLLLQQLAICRAQFLDPTAQDDSPHLDPVFDPVVQFGYPQSESEFCGDVNALTIGEASSGNNTASSGSDAASCLMVKGSNGDGFVGDCDDVKATIGVGDVRFDGDEMVERRFVASTPLMISS